MIETGALCRSRRSTRWFSPALAFPLLALNLLAITGSLARARIVLLALLLYLPLVPLGLAAVFLDFMCRGRALAGVRFSLTGIGLAAVSYSCLTMIGGGPARPPDAGGAADSEVRLLHWNVLSGGWPRTDATWTSIEDAIARRRPDIVVLNEAPPAHRLDALERRLGVGWNSARVARDPSSPDGYKLVVLSRWPIRKQAMVTIRNGTAVDVRVGLPDHEVRLLVIDSRSKIPDDDGPIAETTRCEKPAIGRKRDAANARRVAV
jgi:hypothetical protein